MTVIRALCELSLIYPLPKPLPVEVIDGRFIQVNVCGRRATHNAGPPQRWIEVTSKATLTFCERYEIIACAPSFHYHNLYGRKTKPLTF
jgi:hypothetical protein